MSDPQNYTVGYICALTTEAIAARAFLDEIHAPPAEVSQHDNNAYTLGKIGSHNVVIAVLPRGKYGHVNAASVARDMLHTFPNLRVGLMVGIGGGAPSQEQDVRLGDVVVSCPVNGQTGVIQYDFGKAIQDQAFKETGTVTPPPPLVLTAIAGLEMVHNFDGHQIEQDIDAVLKKNKRLQNGFSRPPAATDRLYKSDFTHRDAESSGCDACGEEPSALVLRHQRGEDGIEDNLKVHYGLIATANTLMKDAIFRDKMAAERGVLCFEMEAAGLMDHFPCLVIRGICDYSDSHKNKMWQGYAAMAAAAYAADLLRQIPPNKVESAKKIQHVLNDMEKGISGIHQVSQEIKTEIQAIKEENFALRIKAWLSPTDPSTNFNHAKKIRHTGTGKWLLQSDSFVEWEHGARRHLWLYGMPGCGKTILLSTILDHQRQKGDKITLAFFFDFNDTKKQKLEALLRSLIFQLYTSEAKSEKHLHQLFEKLDDGEQQPGIDMMTACLKSMLDVCDKTAILIDALDECSQRCELLRWMERFALTLSTVQLIVTSRPEDGFNRSISGWVAPDDRLPFCNASINSDIRSYANSRLDGPEFKRWATAPGTLTLIKDIIGSKANGMFRWVVCQLDSLAECFSREELEDALESLPDDLSTTYKRILDNIPRKRRQKTIRLLMVLAYAERPLDLAEAVDVVAVRHDERLPGPSSFHVNDRLPDPEEITGYCSSLVSLVRHPSGRQATTLRLAHFSVKEYLLGSNASDLPKPANLIVNVCLGYLGSLKQTGSYMATLAITYPFASLAAKMWICHARCAEKSKSSLDAISDFFQDKDRFLGWVQLHDPYRLWQESHNMPSIMQALPIYIACFESLEATLEILLAKGADARVGGGDYGSALQIASSRGNETIIRLLIDHGAEVNANTGRYDAAIHSASARGYESIVRLLIEHGADANLKGRYGSALLQASNMGHTGIVRILLENGAVVNPGDPALFQAAAGGYHDIVQLLLNHGADVNAPNSDAGTAIQIAAAKGSEKVVRMLLTHGADFNSGGPYGSALLHASHRGHEAIVKLLLQYGADVNATSGVYGSALQAASVSGHELIARRLLRHGAEVNTKGGKYGSALQAAVAAGHTTVAALLIDRGADVHATGGVFGCVLYAAIIQGSEPILRLLLNQNVDVNQSIENYGSAIQITSRRGHANIVRLLLELGADVEMKDDRFSSAIQDAAEEGHETIVQMLLDKGADVDTQSGGKGTPIRLALENGHDAVVQLLLVHGVDINAHSDEFGSLIQSASEKGQHTIVQRLLHYGADVNVNGGRKGSALQLASGNGHKEIVRLLLAQGADIDLNSDEQGSALQRASKNKHFAVARLLLEHKANADLCSPQMGTALQLAVENRSEGIVQLLLEHGADINVDGGSKGSAIYLANKNHLRRIVRLLEKRSVESERPVTPPRIRTRQGT